MRTRNTYAAATMGAAVLLGSVVAAVPAHAGGGGDFTQRTGACSMGSTWIAKAKPQLNRNELEFSVETQRAGQMWSVTIKDNRAVVFSGNRRTNARSRSLSVDRLIADGAGADRFTARAVNARTGEVCRGHVALSG